MNKKTFTWHGKKYYLIGTKDGEDLYLEQASFDCSWYWGLGYVETFTNKRHPERSADISSHSHFKLEFPHFKDLMDLDTPYTSDEKWKIYEIMLSLYTAREYSDMIHRGGSHFTSNPAKDIIQDDAEYKRINEKVIPAMLEELYKIMEGRAA